MKLDNETRKLLEDCLEVIKPETILSKRLIEALKPKTFKIGDVVRINAIDKQGTVVGVNVDTSRYEVDYFIGNALCKIHNIAADELSLV